MSDDLLVLRAERERRRRAEMAIEAPKYDWYGPDCGCPAEGRKQDGSCPIHKRARPSQRPPEDFIIWYYEAGRGAGKTEAGAQWIQHCAETLPPKSQFIMAAPTAEAIRSVMLDGPSGVMKVAKPWFYPDYQVSKSRLIWPNGTIALLLSGDEPERFRGPQCHKAWCLAGDTPVLMGDGTEKPLASVGAGDMVATRSGPRRVRASMLTRRNAGVIRLETVDGRVIIGTHDHPVYVRGRGFMRIDTLRPGMELCAIGASNGMATPGISGPRGTTSGGRGSIARSGSRSTGRSRRGTTSTTRTAIVSTTGSTTWNSCRSRSTRPSTSTSTSDPTCRRPMRLPGRPASGIGVAGNPGHSCASSAAGDTPAGRPIRRDSVPPPASRRRVRARSAARIGCASIAAPGTRPPSGSSDSAREGATITPARTGSPRSRSARSPVPPAGSPSRVHGRTPASAAGAVPPVTTDTISSVRRLARPCDVYDISVEDAGEFFAGGILVHNCDEPASFRYPEAIDMLLLGLRLGEEPQLCMTGTPKPHPWLRRIKKREGTVVVKGTTYDNVANLAKSFFATVIRPFEGTRLGRQELNAEDLEDTPGALWTTALLDALRVDPKDLPERVRVAVAVDPSVADPSVSMEDSTAECGITAGMMGYVEHETLGTIPHGYLLADRSLRGHPVAWARAAVAAYREFAADCIVAESNNGGAMVAATINSVDASVPVRLVHASRGKQIRAEPIAALYEQRRIFHVRGRDFAALEAQLCTWVPGLKSPDRLDSLVWLMTELMMGGVPLSFGPHPFEDWR